CDILASAQMKKKIVLIVFGSLFAVVALVAALFYLKGPFVGFPGSRTADGSRAVTDGGVKVAGWTGSVDAAEQKAGMSITDAKPAQEGDALHATGGPASTFWMNDAKASGDYTVRATFNEPKYMNLNTHPHPYGVFIGGNDMGTADQTDPYFAAYGNGRAIRRGIRPAPLPTTA